MILGGWVSTLLHFVLQSVLYFSCFPLEVIWKSIAIDCCLRRESKKTDRTQFQFCQQSSVASLATHKLQIDELRAGQSISNNKSIVSFLARSTANCYRESLKLSPLMQNTLPEQRRTESTKKSIENILSTKIGCNNYNVLFRPTQSCRISAFININEAAAAPAI